ncbi:MAG: hypothetical protein GEU99_04880 [Luteitalea sp.]|nr:hypothetical protein [Luteitalea sp.]
MGTHLLARPSGRPPQLLRPGVHALPARGICSVAAAHAVGCPVSSHSDVAAVPPSYEEPGARSQEPRLSVLRPVIEQITQHARTEWPNECCGLLIGTDDRIDEAVPARNLRLSPSRFLVDPRDHLVAVRRARASRRTVVGAYHSHPDTPPVPSPRDLRESTYPEFVYLICGPVRQQGPLPVRAWRLGREHFTELLLVMTG